MKHFILAVAIATLGSTSASAQTSLGNGGTIFMLSGQCTKLVIGDKSYDADCSPGLMSSQYPNRRVGFHFSTQRGFGASFSGMDGDNPTDNSDVTIIDKVIINESGKDAKPYNASGKCLYENPFAGVPAKVECTGKLKDGRKFSASFLSDGSKPN